MTAYSREFEDELAANLEIRRTKTPREQQFFSSPTLLLMRKKEVSTQGHYIVGDAQFVGSAVGGAIGENTAGSASHVPSLDRWQYEPITMAEPAAISKVKEDKCTGSRALFNEWDRRMTVAEMRQETQLATHLWAATQAATAGPKGDAGITPIPVLLPTDNTTGTMGGISRATKTWWRHYSNTTGGAYTSVGPDRMDAMQQQLVDRAGGKPSFYAMSPNIWLKAKKLARSGTTNFNPTYEGSFKKVLNDADIDAISWGGIPVVSDTYMTDGVGNGFVYAINNKALYLGLHKAPHIGGPYSMQPAQHAKCMFHYIGIQTLCDEPRKCGQLSGLT